MPELKESFIKAIGYMIRLVVLVVLFAVALLMLATSLIAGATS